MDIYSYDGVSGRFLGQSQADVCPATQDLIAERALRLTQQAANARAQAADAELPYPEARDPAEIPELGTAYLMPANTTTLAPALPPLAGMWPYFIDGKWQSMPDNTTVDDLAEPVEKSHEQVRAERRGFALTALNEHADGIARGMGYQNILEAISYADEPAVPQYQAEGLALRAWRSVFREASLKLLAEIEAGTKPDFAGRDELLAALPSFPLAAKEQS